MEKWEKGKMMKNENMIKKGKNGKMQKWKKWKI